MEITIRGHELHAEEVKLSQKDLIFYAENPRIYNRVRPDKSDPKQDKIEEILKKDEDVKELASDIERNGGLVEPVIVKKVKDKYVVLEGNRRLAAYRILRKKNSVKWASLKCHVIDSSIDDATTFSLLGQYHLHTKKDWKPFEQATFLYRRHKEHKVTIISLAKDANLSEPKVNKMINNIQLMITADDLSENNYSYYDVINTKQSIKKAKENDPTFIKKISKKIQDKEFQSAQDFRENFSKICEKPDGKNYKKFMSGDRTYDEAKEHITTSKDGGLEKKLKSFLSFLIDNQEEIESSSGDARHKFRIPLKEINKLVPKIYEEIKHKN
jgi:ParB/RepB/Spo0J family partition protein